MVVRRWPAFLNDAAHLTYRSRKLDHVTPLLHDLHWLRIPERITFRLAVLAYRCQNGLVPQYLADDRVGRVTARRRLWHWSSQPWRVLRSAIALSLLLLLMCGTAFGSQWCHQRPFRFSENIFFMYRAWSCSRLTLRHGNLISFYISLDPPTFANCQQSFERRITIFRLRNEVLLVNCFLG